jgi:hypothetical protein
LHKKSALHDAQPGVLTPGKAIIVARRGSDD